MAVASEEPKFKEELGTIEQWFRLLSESEQTATMYTLFQTLNYGQIKFLMAVLQQMVDAVVGDTSARPRSRSPRPPSLNLSTPKTAHFNPATPATPAPHAQEIIVKPSEEPTTSWASMVNTPLDLMFKKSSDKPNTPNLQTMMNGASPLNMSTAKLTSMGFSTETQMMAIQLVMSGLVKPPSTSSAPPEESEPPVGTPPKTEKPRRAHSPATTASNWRNPTRYPSSALRSAKSSGPRSAGTLRSAGSTGSGTTPKEEDIDPELLEDVPAWLKSLRLHKYTACFEGMTWRQMVDLDEPTMETMGVVALGARRRLTKTFEAVKLKMGIPSSSLVPASATVASSALSGVPLPAVPHSAAP
ncbi:hypothetical protein BDZ89DRAFT_1072201 [Hymenopellis radicata]|nr:hypothetical protein BDZ89DRAFT_1072201 [Hymenopellis radicata]